MNSPSPFGSHGRRKDPSVSPLRKGDGDAPPCEGGGGGGRNKTSRFPNLHPSAAAIDSEIDTAIVDIPLDQDDPERGDGQPPPPFLATRRDLLRPHDGVVTDLDPVGVGLVGGGALGDEAAGGDVALAGVEQ